MDMKMAGAKVYTMVDGSADLMGFERAVERAVG